MRKVNVTSPKHIGTNSMEVSTWKLLETCFFSHLLTIDALSKTVKRVDLEFLTKKRENDAFCSTGIGVDDALSTIDAQPSMMIMFQMWVKLENAIGFRSKEHAPNRDTNLIPCSNYPSG